MAYKCKNCGKFVAKDAAVCKHCGQENPAILANGTSGVNNRKVSKVAGSNGDSCLIQCPNCGSQLTLPRQFRTDYYLHCNICQQEFANPLKPMGKSENFLKKNGCLIFIIFIVIISAIAYITDGGERIKADGTTVYTITKDIYAPSTEAAAKAMINSMARNGNDPISNLEHVYNNDADFTHVFANDKVVVIRKISSGYLIRKLRDYQTAVVPNDSYLKE
jgi:hypothetical protein